MRPRHPLLLALTLLFLAPAAWAQTIANPSFEADHYYSGAGYASQNGGSITGWTISDPTRIGLNLGGTNTPGLFADNGAIPNGTNVAFIQTQGPTNTLSTTITGLTPGAAYRVTFRANRRSDYDVPNATWSLNGGAYVHFTCAPPVGGSNPYYTNSGAFVATGTTAALALRNGTNVTVDATVLLDNFSIAQILVVSNLNDTGAGSFRQAVLDAATVAGSPTITFAPAVNGQTITLTNGQITLATNLTIDASALTNGIAINGNHAGRIFQVNSGITVILNWLTLTNGYANGGDGGGILNSGTLTLNRCTVAHNVSVNSVLGGGGVANEASGTLTLNECTVAGNTTDQFGGGVGNFGALTVNQSTIVQNSAFGGGGIDFRGDYLVLTNTIVAGNTQDGFGVADLYNEYRTLSASHCLIGDGSYSTVTNGVNGNIAGTTASPVNALLAPLGNYGGPTPTLLPEPGSPAIAAGNVAAASQFSTDQRGLPRVVLGKVDIGAVESGDPIPGFVPVVTVNGDAFSPIGTGVVSLREAVAFATNNSTITFTNTLSGQTITLTSGQIVLNGSVTIDASALSGGILINGNQASRVFDVAGGTVLLNSLTITNGNDNTGYGGGGIYNAATLTLTNCTLAGNSAGSFSLNGGGALEEFGGTLVASQCTLAGNSADDSADGGGGIFAYNGTVTLNQCTLTGNSANGSVGGGDGINNYLNTMVLNQCTVSGNGSAGGIVNHGTVTVGNSIVAGNAGGDLGGGGYTTNGVNFVGGNPVLAPLGSYGGPTQTMPPLPGSPVIDGCTNGTSFTTDQRGPGFPRIVGPYADIGAVEFGDAIPGFTPVVTVNGDAYHPIGSGVVSLRDALAFAANNATVTFAPGLSGQTITLANGELILSQNLTLDPTSLPTGLTISGGGASRLFTVSPGKTVLLRGLTLTGGNGAGAMYSDYGGALLNLGALSLVDCTLAGNSAVDGGGGGIYNLGVSLSLVNCTLAGNTAYSGGAISNDSGAGHPATLTHCTLTANQCTGTLITFDGGGAIDNYTAALALTNCILAGNSSASGAGPDLWMESGFPAAINCLIGNGADSMITNGLNGNQVGASDSPLSPLLAPLANYGGTTQTMPPQPGSPAIDAAAPTTLTTDQRGFPRPVGPAPDIGAVEFQASPVLTTVDSIPGSLRYAVTYVTNNATITFGANLSGSIILVTNGQIVMSKNLTLDGSALPGGVAISGNHTNRIFVFNSGTTNLLRDLTLTNGYVGTGNAGGAINNSGTLTLAGCTLVSNTAPDAGALGNNSLCTLRNCTLTGNTATTGNGGAVDNLNSALLYVMHSTLFGNYAGAGAGGIDNYLSQLYITNSIIAGNTSIDAGNDIYNWASSTVTAAGSNIVQSLVNAGTENGAAMLIAANPLLAPLGNYGGPTPTMPPLPGSPAIDRATATPLIIDQRNFPRPVGLAPDIGAVEGVYYAAGPGKIKTITQLGNGSIQLSFTNVTDAVFPVLAATNLSQSPVNWIQIGFATNSPVGSGQFPFTDTQATNYPQRFYRIRSP